MIKVINIRQSNGIEVTADLVADTKSEVSSSSVIVGLPTVAELQIGSTIITTEGEYAICNSNGEWVWQDEEEEVQTVSASPSVQTLNMGRSILNSADIKTPSEPDEPHEETEELAEND